MQSTFTDRNIQLDLIVCEGRICGAHGYLIGNFTGPFLGEPSKQIIRHKQDLYRYLYLAEV